MTSVHKSTAFFKTIVCTLCFCFLFSTLTSPFAQASIWKERRQTLKDLKQKKHTSLASASITGGFNPSLGYANIQNVQTSVTVPQKIKDWGIPDWFWRKISPYGTIENVSIQDNTFESEVPVLKQPLIIHIQDAHQIYEVQKNIAFILKNLTQADVREIGLEGASGNLEHLSGWKKHPHYASFLQWTQYLTKEGYLTGAEAAALSQKNEGIHYFGLEEPTTYLDQIETFKSSLLQTEKIHDWITEVRQEIRRLKDNHYTPQMKQLDQAKKKYSNRKIELNTYLKTLIQPFGPELLKSFPNIEKTLQLSQIKNGVNFSQLRKAQNQLLKDIHNQTPMSHQLQFAEMVRQYRSGSISDHQFYTALKKTCSHPNIKFPNLLEQHYHYVSLLKSIQPQEVLAELKNMERTVWKKICSPDQFEVYSIDQDFILAQKALDFKLTSQDWEHYKNKKKAILKLGARLNVSSPNLPPEVVKILENAQKFNRYSEERSIYFVEHLTQQTVNSRKPAVLICGGYHSGQIESILKKRGLSFITIRPKINSIASYRKMHPLDFFKRAPRPLEKLFLSEKVSMAPPLASGNFPTPSRKVIEWTLGFPGHHLKKFPTQETLNKFLKENSETVLTSGKLADIFEENVSGYFAIIQENSIWNRIKKFSHTSFGRAKAFSYASLQVLKSFFGKERQQFIQEQEVYHRHWLYRAYSPIRTGWAFLSNAANPWVYAHYGMLYLKDRIESLEFYYQNKLKNPKLSEAQKKITQRKCHLMHTAKILLSGADTIYAPMTALLSYGTSISAYSAMRLLQAVGYPVSKNWKSAVYLFSDILKDFSVPKLRKDHWENELRKEYQELRRMESVFKSKIQSLPDHNAPSLSGLNQRAEDFNQSHDLFYRTYGYSPIELSEAFSASLLPALASPQEEIFENDQSPVPSEIGFTTPILSTLVLSPFLGKNFVLLLLPLLSALNPVAATQIKKKKRRNLPVQGPKTAEEFINEVHRKGQNREYKIISEALRDYYKAAEISFKLKSFDDYLDFLSTSNTPTIPTCLTFIQNIFSLGIQFGQWEIMLKTLELLKSIFPEQKIYCNRMKKTITLLKEDPLLKEGIFLESQNQNDRLKLGKMYLKLGRYTEAISHLSVLKFKDRVEEAKRVNLIAEAKKKSQGKYILNYSKNLDIFRKIAQGNIKGKRITIIGEYHDNPDTKNFNSFLKGLAQKGLIVLFKEGFCRFNNHPESLVFSTEDPFVHIFSGLILGLNKNFLKNPNKTEKESIVFILKQIKSKLPKELLDLSGIEEIERLPEETFFDHLISQNGIPKIRDILKKIAHDLIPKLIRMDSSLEEEKLKSFVEHPNSPEFNEFIIFYRNQIALRRFKKMTKLLPSNAPQEIVITVGALHVPFWIEQLGFEDGKLLYKTAPLSSQFLSSVEIEKIRSPIEKSLNKGTDHKKSSKKRRPQQDYKNELNLFPKLFNWWQSALWESAVLGGLVVGVPILLMLIPSLDSALFLTLYRLSILGWGVLIHWEWIKLHGPRPFITKKKGLFFHLTSTTLSLPLTGILSVFFSLERSVMIGSVTWWMIHTALHLQFNFNKKALLKSKNKKPKESIEAQLRTLPYLSESEIESSEIQVFDIRSPQTAPPLFQSGFETSIASIEKSNLRRRSQEN